MNEECWLPSLELINDYDNNWEQYQSVLYEIFKKDFMESFPIYNGSKVNIKRYPIEYGKEEAFFHITCKDYMGDGNRVPDFRRCERIRWVRAFIENNCDLASCGNCDGIKVWSEPYKNKRRIHILLEEEKYMVVLEHRQKNNNRQEFYLLITAFYFDYDNALEKQLKHYDKYRDA